MKDSTVEELDNLHRQARTARARLEPVWYLNLAYYMGEQWVAWDGRQLYRPAMPRNRITVVDNRIQPCVRTEIAKMTKSRPIFTVTPKSGDEEDANASELSEQIMRYLWKHLTMQELVMKALHWSRICGAGFLKAFWDKSIGESQDVLVGPDGKVIQGADGKVMRPDMLDPSSLPGVSVKRIAAGDVRVEVRSPFQMFLDPLADSFSECEWAIEESIKSQSYVQRRYGVVLQPDTAANPGLIEARMGSVFMPGTGGYKGIKVREYWCRPCPDHPGGRRAVWAQNKLLEEDGAPFDPMPYVMLSGISIPGRLWPTSIVEQLRGPQTELNKVKSQIAENRNRVGNPTILASKQAVQDPDKFVSSMTVPGGAYFYDDVGSPNAKPDFLMAPPLPDYVIEEIQRIEESIQEISGQHEVTSAQVPPGVTAASAINLLMEADDTRLGPAMNDFETQVGALGQKSLNLVAKYYSDARTIRLSGENGSWQIFDFRGTQLRDNTQVEVQAGSAFPRSAAAKQAAMQDLLTFFVQSGNPPQGRKLAQFLQDWEVGGADRLLADYSVDETQCNRENALLAQGKPQPINDYDDDGAHIANHTDFQKRPHYAQLPPNVKQIFEFHVQAHRQRLAQQQQAQMQMQMQMQGTPPPEQQQQQAQQQADMQQQQAATEQQQAQQEMAGQLQQQQMDADQGQQQIALKGAQSAQQQGYQQSQAEQTQRQAEEQHQQRIRHAEEVHKAKLKQQEEAARQQAHQQAAAAKRTQGAPSGRSNRKS